jgi:hypothetical protein
MRSADALGERRRFRQLPTQGRSVMLKRDDSKFANDTAEMKLAKAGRRLALPVAIFQR